MRSRVVEAERSRGAAKFMASVDLGGGPVRPEVEGTVDRGVSTGGGVSEVDGDLTQSDPAQGPKYNKCSAEGCWWESEV